MDTFHLKAIETKFQGYTFRSRLEARYAVFFSTLGIEYRYEDEGYDLEGTWYLPDFYLPTYNIFVETKGQEPTEEEKKKAELLALYSGKDVYIFFGNICSPDDPHHKGAFRYNAPALHMMKDSIDNTSSVEITPTVTDLSYELIQTLAKMSPRNEYGLVTVMSGLDGDTMYEVFLELVDISDGWHWGECDTCGTIHLRKNEGSTGVVTNDFFYSHGNRCAGKLKNNSPRLIAAYTSARSARFEREV